ncbi:MAG: hypothetical protein JWQ34_1411 [Mucilaginibacter sp.]|uniref:hypothetical protein n=1 Tax=Mucilaginibacter sp. TaxID=1882438 RepID=UPI0026145529|nr:hypothetical protein [Mucilaginibacter sp.]MDB5003186.1 hypothetical protein [Mucilaginibacter sp.]
MVITKDKLQNILNDMPDKIDVEEIFDRIILSAKIEQALRESNQGLGQDWNEFKTEWLKEGL